MEGVSEGGRGRRGKGREEGRWSGMGVGCVGVWECGSVGVRECGSVGGCGSVRVSVGALECGSFGMREYGSARLCE